MTSQRWGGRSLWLHRDGNAGSLRLHRDGSEKNLWHHRDGGGEVKDFTEMGEEDVYDFTKMGRKSSNDLREVVMREFYDFTEIGDCMQMFVTSLKWWWRQSLWFHKGRGWKQMSDLIEIVFEGTFLAYRRDPAVLWCHNSWRERVLSLFYAFMMIGNNF